MARILVVHSDPAEAANIKAQLFEFGASEVECVDAAIDGIACFELFRPQAVLFYAGMPDLPARFVVEALKQLEPGALVWLIDEKVSMGLKEEAKTFGAAGAVSIPLEQDDYQRLTQPPQDSHDDTANSETVKGWIDDTLWDNTEGEVRRATIPADEINRMKIYRHAGDLKILGNLREVTELSVTGRLFVDGETIETHIRCAGDLEIAGRVIRCNNPGLFCRSVGDVLEVVESVVVCGKHLFFSMGCRDSTVNVAGRMVGKSNKTEIIGGTTRVGEHLSVGSIGDDSGCQTRVELAPGLFFDTWRQARASLASRDEAFSNTLTLDSYRHCADLVADHIESGVNLKIGETDDLVITPKTQRVRVMLQREEGEDRIHYQEK